jgi:hypothetical protein
MLKAYTPSVTHPCHIVYHVINYSDAFKIIGVGGCFTPSYVSATDYLYPSPPLQILQIFRDPTQCECFFLNAKSVHPFQNTGTVPLYHGQFQIS